MKKLILSLLVAAFVGGNTLSAQTITKNEDGKYSLSVGHVTLTVDAQKGGKIVSYRYDDKEILSQTKIPNSFGSTFWTSPQSEWNWPPVPEYDTKPFNAEVAGDKLILTGEKSKRFGYRVRKELTTDKKDNAIVITYTIINESGETRKVAPWEISRVPNGGILFFDAKEVTPANNMETMPFVYEKKAAWYTLDESRKNRKINADGKGWLAFCDNGLLFVKKFPDLKPAEPAPAEAEIQIYVNTGKTFVEIEEQGAYTTLNAGEELSWTVRWYLEPTDLPAEPSKALLKKALKMIK
ncbi:MAG: hypothetical protein IIW32_02140 [Bacteroides sp.]|jgi:hypothetical protein|nr:hypothetical protein [Bacteroides sp.]